MYVHVFKLFGRFGCVENVVSSLGQIPFDGFNEADRGTSLTWGIADFTCLIISMKSRLSLRGCQLFDNLFEEFEAANRSVAEIFTEAGRDGFIQKLTSLGGSTYKILDTIFVRAASPDGATPSDALDCFSERILTFGCYSYFLDEAMA